MLWTAPPPGAQTPRNSVADAGNHDPEELINMQAIATVGLDIAKSVFQVHGVDAQGRAVIRRQLKRRYVLC